MDRPSLVSLFSRILIALCFGIAQPQQYFCSNNGTYSVNSTYRNNLHLLLSSLPSSIAENGIFYKATVGQGPDKVYALALCREDLPSEKCSSCVNTTSQGIKKQCPDQKEALLWTDSNCLVRYANRDIFAKMEEEISSFCVSNPNDFSGDFARFNKTLHDLMEELITQASSGPKKFATGYVNFTKPIYGLVQCTPDISERDCGICLQKGMGEMESCAGGREGGRILIPSCIVWFELYRFYIIPAGTVDDPLQVPPGAAPILPPQPPSPPSPANASPLNETRNKIVIIIVAAVAILVTLITIICALFLCRRMKQKVESFCSEGQERILVYEFLGNGSLDKFIFDPIKSTQLNWETRCRIISGIARGILYLHEDSRLRIIHRDLKASNVLLDEEMNPKVSDFGLARQFQPDQTQRITSRVAGTYGYMAPEYALQNRFSVKSDVFSFGVLVLEIVTGKKNSWLSNSEELELLLIHVWRNWREGTATNLIDETLRGSPVGDVMRCLHIGLLCVQENVSSRPTMAAVVPMLNSHSWSLPSPSRPAFLLDSNTDTGLPSLESDTGTTTQDQSTENTQGTAYLLKFSD
ncbi:hypothetical protein POTOM_037645 [Populus tomentosa]|uniref:Cysteine-rich receptor-like protein kinase 10 n=1 Tax=Populus tomentosa TaxID=118781 RepID=A0A8X7YXR1_POPTO|nr:hypothetical protein POTOM_037645 [Populus tomentosa]